MRRRTPSSSSEPNPEPSPHQSEEKEMLQALSSQVDRLQLRESRQQSELERLRRLVAEASQSPNGSPFQSPPKHVQHIEEIEALRREKRDLQLHNCELEVQIQDAAQSIDGFSAAIEKLEEGYKTKEDTWKRQIADLQQECDGLARTNRQLQSQFTQGEKAKASLVQKEQVIEDLRAQLDTCRHQLAEAMQDRQDLSTAQDTLQSTRVALQQAEARNAGLASQLEALQQTHNETLRSLEAKSRQLSHVDMTSRPHGQSVLVKTLRDEVRLLKGQLEAQFRDEKTQLGQRIQSLEAQLQAAQNTVRQKDEAIRQQEQRASDLDLQLTSLLDQKRAMETKLERVQHDLATAHDEMRQLQACRGFLGEHIELGFKELLEHDAQIEALERDLSLATSKAQTVSLEAANLRDELAQANESNELLRRQLDSCRAELATHSTATARAEMLAAEKTAWATQEASLKREIETLQGQVNDTKDYDQVVRRLRDAEHRLETWQHAKDNVKARNDQVKNLMERLEAISERNIMLDEALQQAMAQSKQDHTDMVALRARLKVSKQKADRFDAAQQALAAAQDKLRDVTSMKHLYKQQLDTAKRRVDELEREKSKHGMEAGEWKRKEDHMHAIVEAHTKQLVHEIESLQAKCTKATKKYHAAVEARRALELELHERNAIISKLHQAVAVASTLPSPSAAPARGMPSTATRLKPEDKIRLPSPPNPADEMETLLKKLERISQQYK
ncbi:unnamed protein product [Aphanomyces euteiches]|uniref:Uncharacterized protein n=1 Tax=Aphanomyces euteiches TaxID=100861 RepID=A0A6G0WB70_9STRA|nr:hypothetical protein Ae201684_016808 [Aphanomyces euteiches]KAH9075912.1 hypothetical protein Ae201684P_012404 [Aphanomyces euteiches]KAH9151324.1 hypothetical protein AeRB84_006033 [Aphanomyces euteiches]